MIFLTILMIVVETYYDDEILEDRVVFDTTRFQKHSV